MEERQLPPSPKHETRDVPIRPFAWFLIGMVVGAILIHAGLAWMARIYDELNRAKQGPVSPIAQRPIEPPNPPLLISNELLAKLRQTERQHLQTPRGTERGQGFVAMPIEEAMDEVVRSGLPDWRNETTFTVPYRTAKP